MTVNAHLYEIEIENFRGFALRQEIPLDADVVLITGGNGTGKTSLTDAVAWCLTGELPGLAERLKGERKGEDYIRSYYGSGPARVRLRILADGEKWDIERRGDATGSDLHLAHATDGDRHVETQLATLFGFDDPEHLVVGVQAWGVLRQDAMRGTLEQGSESLHRRLREILGLSALAEFEAAARDAASSVGREAAEARKALDDIAAKLRDARRELDLAEQSDATRSDAREAVNAQLERLRTPAVGGMRIELPVDVTSRELASIGQEIDGLIREAREIGQDLASLPSTLKPVSDEALQQLRGRHAAAERARRDLEARQSAERRLAESAITLLTDHCPVCEQTIDQIRVRERLEQIVAADAHAADGEEARKALESVTVTLEDAERTTRTAEAAAKTRSGIEQRWGNVLGNARRLTVPPSWRAVDNVHEALRGSEDARNPVQTTYRALRAVETDPAITAKRARVEELESAKTSARERATAAGAREIQADALRRAAVETSVEITEQSLKSLEPAFAELYDRLAPHPSFTTLRMFHDVYYGRGRSTPRIFDPVRGIEANPNLVCSEGQLNIIALSYFLALNLETDSGGLPFAILDDPLQAMDVLNVLGFCDVARELRLRRQLLLTTHDRRFAALLERKLGPRSEEQRTLLLHFSSWDREGPRVEVERPEVERVPSLLGLAA